MFKFLTLMLVSSVVMASDVYPNTSADREICLLLYRQTERVLSEANGRIWAQHGKGLATFEEQAAAQHANVIRSMDQRERLLQGTHAKWTAYECGMQASYAQSVINEQTDQFIHATDPRK